MDRLAYIAMSGAKQTLLAQATNANNLANVNTQGFKADLDAYTSLPVYGPTYASRVYAQDVRTGTDFQPGPLMTTGRDLDIALKGQGFIAVQAPDGSVAYTRRGDLHVSPNGQLQTAEGDPVMGNQGPIAIPPANRIDILADGTISIIPLGGTPNAPAQIDRIRLVNPPATALEKRADGLFGLKPNTPAPQPDATIQVASGVLEGSNVNAVDAMVKMIEYGRLFEMQTKMIKTAGEDSANADKLLQFS
ncbi:flagellar basal-body rod protein FlgF [Halothiobacillus diazotrophicus]|uniref:Flagellar basal-body rod protein FlgF n=1 Tax=Halothiobacillus diazotrophicus TaxID=1860122 RepID=A0A191ZJU4_9GAMM|nr:flagellar basal-body rod protein FlgF [Halothiobacillus diazotrophicus]ANJ68108.1 flagellar basal-body rod protein FlgF [Halothiobacillus diazotrophicus]